MFLVFFFVFPWAGFGLKCLLNMFSSMHMYVVVSYVYKVHYALHRFVAVARAEKMVVESLFYRLGTSAKAYFSFQKECSIEIRDI